MPTLCQALHEEQRAVGASDHFFVVGEGRDGEGFAMCSLEF